MRTLLLEWCDGLLAHQINDPSDPTRHGALRCPACTHIHGRCMDAMYPLFHAAKATGDKRYEKAGRAVFAWAEQNVAQANGSWTVIADPKSWAGITIFGAIALAETLHHHGELLDEITRTAWTDRLRHAADYVHRTFTIDFTNINYPAAGVYGLHLFGTVLNEPKYQAHARELARGVHDYFTEPNGLLFGEGKPSRARSPRGLYPVDLGYNVEESLVALSLYAVDAGDRELEALVVRSWQSHLEFMLPDGAWDNSWGTRHAKWSYWGSRTCDGCQPGLAALAHRDPTFARAARSNLDLLRICTASGLLHGGLHYAEAGIPPCIHHTFTHAKALATVLDRGDLGDEIAAPGELPRAGRSRLREFPEIATWLVSRGGWRGTVTAYDFVYRPDVRQPTGGSLSLLWHDALGPIFAGSMARYVKVEANNMQDHFGGRDDILTPRVEVELGEERYSQGWDLAAEVRAIETASGVVFEVSTLPKNEAGEPYQEDADPILQQLTFEERGVTIQVRAPVRWPLQAEASLVFPVIAGGGDRLERLSASEVCLHKADGMLRISTDSELEIDDVPGGRAFNLTPGFRAIPLRVRLAGKGAAGATVNLSVG